MHSPGFPFPWRSALAVALLVGPAPGATRQTALTPAPAWQVQSHREDAGLGERSVFFVDFTPDGTGWFAASDGLYRYDGYGWRRFTQADGLPSDHVRSVLVASTGELWVGTDRGAGTFDGSTFEPLLDLAGPSVRRIVETSDGALWFCCDRWPAADVEAGLTRVRGETCTTWRVADGLPSDYVSDLFETSEGRRFVLTDQGLAELHDGEFRLPIEEAGLGGGRTYIWSMVESQRHGLLVATEDTFFQERGGRWRAIPNSTPQVYLPRLAVTSDDAVIACASGHGPRFLAFDGERFVPVTKPLVGESGSVEIVREDPFGGIWAAGFDFVVRWERADPHWQAYEDLGEPVLCDAEGGIWLGRPSEGTFARLARGATTIVEGSGPLVRGDAGSIWLSSGRDASRWHQGRLDRHRAASLGLERVEPCCLGPDGSLWARGRRPNGEAVLLSYRTKRWSEIRLPDVRPGAQVAVVPDPRSGIWCLVSGSGPVPHRLLRVASGEVVEVPLPARCQLSSRPSLLVDHRGHCWLYGFFGLNVDDGSGWREVPLGRRSVRQGREIGDDVWFVCRGHLGAGGALVRVRAGTPQVFPGPGGSLLHDNGEAGSLFSTTAGLALVRPGTQGPPPLAECPLEGPILGGVRDAEGAYWIQAEGLTVRWRDDRRPPRAWLPETTPVLHAGQPLRLEAGLREHYRPGVRRGGVASWRLDDGPWSPWIQLSRPTTLDEPDVGEHTLAVRVRDWRGLESVSPAELALQVLPVPLQHRAWFAPAVGLVFLALTTLAALAIGAQVRLARQARLLERTVDQRTGQLRASEQRYRTLFEKSCDAVLLFDLDGSLRMANQAARELLAGSDDPLPTSIVEVFADGDEARRFQRSSSGSSSIHGERYRLRSTSGRPIDALLSVNLWYDDESGKNCWQLILHDVTQRTQLEERLQHTQKMEALGRMASGIAHDFNNVLTVILGYGESLRSEVQGQTADHVDQILTAAHRARSLTEQIQAFSRASPSATLVVDTAVRLRELSPSVQELVNEGVEVTLDVPEGVGHVRLDPRQLDQLITNLVVNASQAMPDGGRLAIAASNFTPANAATVTAAAASASERPLGPAVLLEVADTGCGMERETRQRAFEPFFTTKPLGEGTGLGLAIVYGIVQQTGGSIEVESEPGEGTRVRVFLPRCAEPPSAALEELPRPRELGGHETILVVDDEKAIRSLIGSILEHSGYDVRSAGSAAEALRILEQPDGGVDLVLTDIVMPGTSGTELARRIRDLAPSLPVVLMSGYPRPDAGEGRLADLGLPFLSKPFRPATLLARIRQALAEGGTRSARHRA